MPKLLLAFLLLIASTQAAIPVITSFTTTSQTANGGSITLNCGVSGTTTDIEVDNGSAVFTATTSSCGGGISKTPTKTTLYKLVAGNNTGTDGQAWAYQRIFFGAGNLAATVTNCAGATQNSASCVITVSTAGTFTNPYTDMVCDVAFTAPSSTVIRRTSYWDPLALLWKISFRPVESGAYTWAGNCGANPSGGPNNYRAISGSFTSTSSSAPGFLALYGGSAPYRLKTAGNGRPFYAVGIQQGFEPNSTTGVQFFLPMTHGAPNPTNIYPATPDQYFSAYSAAGTNIFRNNGESTSSIFGGQYCDASGLSNFDRDTIVKLDTLAAKADSYGITLQMVPYFNPDPNNVLPAYNFFTTLKTSSCFLNLWLEYFARYGDQAGIWELGNEIVPNVQYIKTLTNFVALRDPYRHLVTLSNVPSAAAGLGLDFTSPHFYFTDTQDPAATQTLDSTMAGGVSGINSLKSTWPNQPIIYGEIGNACPATDADPPANERWRDMLWTAFFNQAGAIAWNSFSGLGGTCASGLQNLFVGIPQRAQQLVFSNWVNGFDALATPVTVTLGNLGSNAARAYALAGASTVGAYITHTNNHSTTVTGATATLNIPASGLTATWIDPSDGSVLGTSNPAAGSRVLTIPAFSKDIVLKVSSQATPAGDHYVSTTGNDGNPGTLALPWRHFTYAAATVSTPGDRVIFLDGTYDNEGVVDDWVVTLTHSGTSGNNIVFMAQNRGGAILDSMNTSTGTTCNGGKSYLNFFHASFITIQGFVITRACDSGFQSNDDAHDITIKWNEIKNIANRQVTDQTGRDGIFLNASEHDFTFDGNIWHDIGRTGGQALNHFDHGIYSKGYNHTIISNLFYNMNAGYAIQIADQANNWMIGNNTFGFRNATPSEAGQIMFWDRDNAITVRNNIFYQPLSSALMELGTSGHVTNSFFDHNLIYGTSAIMDTGNLNGITVGAGNQLNVNPLVVNAGAFDFHLQGSSPARAAGIAVAGVPGTTPDLGAFQLSFDFSLTTTGPHHVTRGRFMTFNVVSAVTAGADEGALTSIAGLPAGVTAVFTNQVKAGGCCGPTTSGLNLTNPITLTASANTAPGVYTLTVTYDSVVSHLIHSVAYSLSVDAAPSMLSRSLPFAADTSVSGLAAYLSNMTTFGNTWCNPPLGPAFEGFVWYYDGTRVMYQIFDRTGDAQFLTCARALDALYLTYVQNNAIQGYHVFPKGLAMGYSRDGVTADRTALVNGLLLNNYGNFQNVAAVVDWALSREMSYGLEANLEAESIGNPRIANFPNVVEVLMGHFSQWFLDRNTLYVQPFMVSLASEALIQYWNSTHDTRVPPMLQLAADQLRAASWDLATTSFLYYNQNGTNASPYDPQCTNWPSSGTGHTCKGPSVDLNLLIVPLYGWVYQHTGDPKYRTWGDEIFNAGVAGGYLGNGKQFSQQYRWSQKYLWWRSTLASCDLNDDNAVNVLDAQVAISQTLGNAPCSADLNGDGACNVTEVQRIIQASLNGACRTGP